MGATGIRRSIRGTVRDALEARRRHGHPETANEALWRFRLAVYEDSIADVALEATTRDDLLEWQDRLLPGREPCTVNRYVRTVIAGLNHAMELGHVENSAAWRMKPLSDNVEDEGRRLSS